MSDYPEHGKLSAVQEQTQAIGEFLDWLAGEGIHLMTWREDMTDTRPTDPECPHKRRDCDGCDHHRDDCAPVRPEEGSYSPDGVFWVSQHCRHWTEPDSDGEYGECCRCHRGRIYEIHGIKAWTGPGRSNMQLLADWAGIDQTKIEAEKRQMLAALREMQKPAPVLGNSSKEG